MTQEQQYQQRLVNLRLSWFRRVQEITHNVAKTCRYYGMARRTYYVWWNIPSRPGVAVIHVSSLKVESRRLSCSR